MITFKTALEIASHEALVRQTYKDSVGVLTWSIGITSATGHDVSRYIGKPQSLDHCLEIYVWALSNYAEAVRSEFSGSNLTEEQFAAALSFHWNTGAIRSATWPDLWKAGRISEARASFMSWRKPASIIDRRTKEAALFFDGVWSSGGDVVEYTRLGGNMVPAWSSAKMISIEEPLRRLLAPDAPAEAVAPAAPKASPVAAVIAAILKLLEWLTKGRRT